MAMRRAFKYRLYPTKPQERDLEKTLDLLRYPEAGTGFGAYWGYALG